MDTYVLMDDEGNLYGVYSTLEKCNDWVTLPENDPYRKYYRIYKRPLDKNYIEYECDSPRDT